MNANEAQEKPADDDDEGTRFSPVTTLSPKSSFPPSTLRTNWGLLIAAVQLANILHTMDEQEQ